MHDIVISTFCRNYAIILYIDACYRCRAACCIDLQVQDHKASSRNRGRNRGSVRTPADDRPSPDNALESSSDSDSSGTGSDGSDSGREGDLDAMDANSLSIRAGASGIRARLRKQRQGVDMPNKSRVGAQGEHDGESSDDDADTGVSRRMADTYITESMSVTPASSVAVGSLMGRSLGKAMASSFADDGLAWGTGGVAGSVDDAFFHENVAHCDSPPMSSTIGDRAAATNLGGKSRRALF